MLPQSMHAILTTFVARMESPHLGQMYFRVDDFFLGGLVISGFPPGSSFPPALPDANFPFGLR